MESREIKLIRKAIELLDLNLEGKTVLTEVGSNNYLYTPIIPAKAGIMGVYK